MTFSAAVNPTLIDIKNASNFDGSVGDVIEVLSQEDEGLMNSLGFQMGNMDTGHQTIQRYALPTPTWLGYNEMTTPTKSKARKIVDTCGMLDDWSEIHVPLAKLNNNSAAWRAQEDRAHIIGMRQEFTSTVWYGNDQVNPKEFTGLSERYNSSVSSATNPQYEQVLKGAGTPNTSIWLINFGKMHGIYPKGSQAGWEVEDLGAETKEVSGTLARVYRTHFHWQCGIAVTDWRGVGRIQVDYSALTKDASSGSDLIDLMSQLTEIVDKSEGRLAWFASRGVKSFLRRQIANKVANSTLSMDSVAGKRVMSFDDIPVYRSDSLLYTETAVA